MGILENRILDNKKTYEVEINTNKIVDVKQLLADFYKKYKKIIRIKKISLHIKIEYWDNTFEE